MVNQSAHGNVRYVTGKIGGKPCWYLIEVHPLKRPIYEKHLKDLYQIDLTRYGTVLMSGWGSAPPTSVEAKVKAEYGVEFTA